MPRWLTRLFVLGLIGVAAAFVLSRLLSREEDFDDFDDIDMGFEFQETPIEIDVPADAGMSGGSAATAEASGAQMGATAGSSAGADTVTMTRPASTKRLSIINGIGPAYESRLESVGINTLEQLAQADANAINEQLDVIGGVAAVEDWIAQAQRLTSGEDQPGSSASEQQ